MDIDPHDDPRERARQSCLEARAAIRHALDAVSSLVGNAGDAEAVRRVLACWGMAEALAPELRVLEAAERRLAAVSGDSQVPPWGRPIVLTDEAHTALLRG